jgi:UDP-N-acetylglucosamine--N-acetylmuramyl-(pentapeptide) pyrophosphoryl-undecaprenol N-acetylglucosamine transferase
MRILIAGGVTGGHFYPALAVMEALLETDHRVEITYVGTRHGIEAAILPTYPRIRFFPIHARGLRQRSPLQNLCALGLLLLATVETFIILLRFRPQVIVGMGGYASFPAVFLGSLLKYVLPMRTIIHEQNVVAGLTNRLLGPLVDKVLVSYHDSKHYFQKSKCIIVTGNPVRREFLLAKRTEALYQQFNLDPKRNTVLVFGGSRGSSILTTAITQASDRLARNNAVQILFVTGSSEEERNLKKVLALSGTRNIVVCNYIDRMGDAFALADLIVCRAGATTLAEITFCGKPALLIPWKGAAGGHQWENARYLQKQGACYVAEEQEFVNTSLAALIEQIINDSENLDRLSRNARRLGRRRATKAMLAEIVTLATEVQT